MTAGTRRSWLKASLLFSNFLLIILAYYLVKTASRSMILETATAAILPYIWIGSALLLMILVPFYQLLVRRIPRFKLVLGTLAIVGSCLLVFRWRLASPTVAETVLFYVFVDIFSVVLVEQFWSLTNSVYRTVQARRWYGVIGSGGLVGGLLAGFAGAALIEHGGLATEDLLLVSTAVLVLMAANTLYLSHSTLLKEVGPPASTPGSRRHAWRVLRENNYLLLVASILLLAQLAAPFVEYQFMTLVGERFDDQEERSIFLSQIFSWISGTALLINLALTPLVHRVFGAIGGLLVQPVMLLAGSMLFLAMPVLHVAAALRISDRGLSYSVNRASRELLYVPVSAETLYRAKAWIDMLGYRLFKVFGSGVIILLTEILPTPFNVAQLSVVVIMICISWMMAIQMIRGRYQSMVAFARQLAPPKPADST